LKTLALFFYIPSNVFFTAVRLKLLEKKKRSLKTRNIRKAKKHIKSRQKNKKQKRKRQGSFAGSLNIRVSRDKKAHKKQVKLGDTKHPEGMC
jgi:hypothetical protein